MQQLVKFVRGTISKEALCGDFEVQGDIPWEPTDVNGNDTCNDPLVELFIAVRNQYRNVIAVSLLPPTRNSDGTIDCHILPSCVAHYTGDLPEKFNQVVNAIYIDICKALEHWNNKWADMYRTYYNISEYTLCNEVTETFIEELGLCKAPPINKSMLLDIVEQFAADKKEEAMKLFDLQEKRTLKLLQ